MLGAGTFINPLIKLIVTLIILGAIYLFFVKPALDTTNNALDSFNFPDISNDVQSQINDAFDTTNDSDQLRACLKRAAEAGNQHRIQVCINKFG